MNAEESPKTPDELRAELSATLYKLAYICAVAGVDPLLAHPEFELAVKKQMVPTRQP